MNKTRRHNFVACAVVQAFALLVATNVLADDGAAFPGPAISPTSVQISGDRAVIGNNALTATYQRDRGKFRLARLQSPLDGLDLSWSDPNLFSILLIGKAEPLRSSAMKLIEGPDEVALTGNPDAARLSQRLPGRMLRATFSDEPSGLSLQWNAIMTDGANYVRQEIRLRATCGPLAIDSIEMIHASLPGAKVAGYTDGSPITNDKLFVGVEHPMAENRVLPPAKFADSAAVVCSLPRRCELQPGATWTVSTGIGIYPAGQLRRGFLYYLERERAHPYRQYWHYNSWFDLNIGRNDNPDPLKRMTEAQCLAVIDAFGRELHDKRAVGLDGFVWDDGWDDWNSLWQFHQGFPNGFARLKEAATGQGAGVGAWLSPWGGYGGSHDRRVQFGRAKGYETNAGGFSLGGPKYFAAFRDTCLKMIRDYNQNYFKFDGIGGGAFATGAPVSIAPDLDGLVRVVGELRRAKPDVFINCTVGTWASPYWTFFADSIWRQGEDCNFACKGNPRERWINYKDSLVYDRFASKSPLFPLNSLMYHGVLLGPTASPGQMPTPAKDLPSFQHEMRMAAGYSSGLGELYVSPALMTPEAWDCMAECINWSRAKKEVMVDTHWIGGDPRKNRIYGFAAWHPKLGAVLTLRNPDDKPQTCSIKLADAFELPPGAATAFELQSPWKSDAHNAPIHADAKTPLEFTLQPFDVLTLESQRATKTGPSTKRSGKRT